MSSPVRKRPRLSSPAKEGSRRGYEFGAPASSSLEPSPSQDKEPDYDAWFDPVPDTSFTGFQTATFASAAPKSTFTGFSKASNKGFIQPSTQALAKLQEKITSIWDEDQQGTTDPDSASQDLTLRPPLSPKKSAVNIAPSMPVSEKLTRPPNSSSGFQTASSTLQPSQTKSFKPPLMTRTQQNKPFHSPLKTSANSTNSVPYSSPLNPSQRALGRSTGVQKGIISSSRLQFQNKPPLPIDLSSNAAAVPFSTPTKRVDKTTKYRSSPGGFVTPFKPGMRPGEPGRLTLEREQQKERVVSAVTKPKSGRNQKTTSSSFFDLTPRTDRQSLASSGLFPQSYSDEDLISMGINVSELKHVTPQLAEFYKFRNCEPSGDHSASRGPESVLKEFLSRGCQLVTSRWITNHWRLILWKLAGLVALDPDSEQDQSTRKWCWEEVMRQFLYRYERELNQGRRPALKMIATQDAPAGLPMVLCISRITSLRTDDHNISAGQMNPELELTDGWYFIRAEIDEPLAQAIRKGTVKVGRKLAITGARLDIERREPKDILDAYDCTKLILSANSTHMAPWHDKLGFQRRPGVSTLRSLSANGGLITLIDVVIIKAHPLGFLEFIVDSNGRRSSEGPRTESEEAKVNDVWKSRREAEAAKLREAHEKNWNRFQGYIQKLERRAGGKVHTEDESPPDHIDVLYDQLEDLEEATSVLSSVSASDAGWLVLYVRQRLEQERLDSAESLAKELDSICPPRDVRCFRALQVQDAQHNRPANRVAVLTVWDIMRISLYEGRQAGFFEVGHRFLISNLMPSKPNAWMGNNEPGSEIYLSTRRDTKWSRVPSKS